MFVKDYIDLFVRVQSSKAKKSSELKFEFYMSQIKMNFYQPSSLLEFVLCQV